MLEKYYKNFMPVLLQDSNWRQFKFHLQDNSWLNIKTRVNSLEKLRFLLQKFLPLDAYQGCDCFLNPERLSFKNFKRKKAGFQYAYNIFLWSDMCIDIDSISEKTKRMTEEICKNREESFENCEKVFDFYKEKGFKDIIVVETFRGYQVWSFDFKDDFKDLDISSPMMREKFYLKKKKEFCDEMKARKIKFDYSSSAYTRRVYRIPLSIHSKGNVCRIFDKPIFLPYLMLPESPDALAKMLQNDQHLMNRMLVRRGGERQFATALGFKAGPPSHDLSLDFISSDKKMNQVQLTKQVVKSAMPSRRLCISENETEGETPSAPRFVI